MANARGIELYMGLGGVSNAPGLGNVTLNANNDGLEYIFQAEVAATITRIGFRQSTLNGTAPVFRISLQGVADGVPDGTIKNSGNAFVDYTPTEGNEGTWQWVTLGATYTCARGEMLSIVFAYQSGTIDGSNNCAFTAALATTPSAGIPYVITVDGGVRSRSASTPVYGFGSADTAYGQPVETNFSSAFSSAGNPDERALKLTLPAGWGATYQILGARFNGVLAAGGTMDLVLYDTDGSTVLQDVSFDTDNVASAAVRWQPILFDEATLADLSFGSSYYLTLKPTSGTHTIYGITVDADADMEAWPLGSGMIMASRVDGGSWTDDPKTRLILHPILADVTEPSGGGGGVKGDRPTVLML